MNKRIFSLAVSCMLMLAACTTQSDKNKRTDKLTFPIYSLRKHDTILPSPYVADIKANRNIEMRARINGILSAILVEEGQAVKAGQLLFKINDREARIAVDKVKASLRSAEAECDMTRVEMKRIRALVDKKIISSSELDLIYAKLNTQAAKADEVRAALKAANAQLSYTEITAPFDGVIDRLPLREGSLVNNGTLLTTLSDIHKVYAYFTIAENEYIKLSRRSAIDSFGQATLILADGTTYPFKGNVVPAESVIDEQTGSIAFRAAFPNPKKLLKHGAAGTLILHKSLRKVILVPQRSVFEIQDKSYVYLVDKDNRIKMKSFIPAQRIGNFYIVSSGLEVNERIVYEGTGKLRDGMRIKVKEIL